MNDAMIFNHFQRMEKFDGPYRAEYETALKHACTTSFIGKVPRFTDSNNYLSLLIYASFCRVGP